MNGYEIVNYLIENGKRYVSENDLYRMGDNKKLHADVAVLVLKNLYSAKYIPPYDAHFCGGYSFENPNSKKVLSHQVYSIYLPINEIEGTPKLTLKAEYRDFNNVCKYIQMCCKENEYENANEKIEQLKNTHHCWINDSTLIFYRQEMVYE